MKESNIAKSLSKARFASLPSRGVLSQMLPKASTSLPGVFPDGSALLRKKVKTLSGERAIVPLKNKRSSNCASASSNSQRRKIS